MTAETATAVRLCPCGKPAEHLDADPDSSEWACRVPVAPRPPLTLGVAPFDHSQGVPEYTGMRGVTLDAQTRFQSGRVFSTDFPTVFVSDGGDVEIGDQLRISRADAAAWFRAVADYLADGPGASKLSHPRGKTQRIETRRNLRRAGTKSRLESRSHVS